MLASHWRSMQGSRGRYTQGVPGAFPPRASVALPSGASVALPPRASVALPSGAPKGHSKLAQGNALWMAFKNRESPERAPQSSKSTRPQIPRPRKPGPDPAKPAAMAIWTQPFPVTIGAGRAANFGVVVTGSPVSFSWHKETGICISPRFRASA